MERLTKRESANVGGREYVLCNYKKEDCNDSCMYGTDCKWKHKALLKLKEYEDAEEQGLLLRLPCKVGDTIYKVWYKPCHNGETYLDSYSCNGCEEECDMKRVIVEIKAPSIKWIVQNMMDDFGFKIYFLTKEEAEQALAKMIEV